MRHLFSGFFAGFLAVLTVHQAVIAAGGALGFLPGATGWAMRPVPPLGIPQVLSLAFWGGIWGMGRGASIDGPSGRGRRMVPVAKPGSSDSPVVFEAGILPIGGCPSITPPLGGGR